MRVCIFIGSIDKTGGGPSRSVPILAKGLAHIGVETTIMFCESDNMNTHVLEGSPVKLDILPRNPSKRILFEHIKEGAFDLVHMQGIWIPIYHIVAKIVRAQNIPYIMTPRGALEPWCLKQKNLKKKIALLLYQKKDLQKADSILATAESEKEHIRNLGFTNRIDVIPNGIEITDYPCRPFGSAGKEKKQVLFLSRIHQKKGIEILVNVWERIGKDYPSWNVVIAGNGENNYIQHLQELIKDKRLDNQIKIVPPVFGEDKYNLYTESALFILPTYSENFGMVIAEALSCGVPVITTTGTPWESLNNGMGWCVELTEVNIEKSLREALEKPSDMLFLMGQKGSKYIQENFLYTSVAKKMAEVYEELIRNK